MAKAKAPKKTAAKASKKPKPKAKRSKTAPIFTTARPKAKEKPPRSAAALVRAARIATICQRSKDGLRAIDELAAGADITELAHLPVIETGPPAPQGHALVAQHVRPRATGSGP